MRCPLCGEPSDADWPLRMPDGSIRDGGCQMCWEKQADEAWWEMLAGLSDGRTNLSSAATPEKA
jgi:hypothetical protein